MARKARQRAENGVYYIKSESLNKLIFFEAEDRRYFISRLLKQAEEDFADVYAYCLFDENISLVLKEGLSGVSKLVQNVLSGYTLWYNARYAREGRLFKDRFKSLPLDDAELILDAVRYVHQLPLKTGESLNYEWSSYHAYTKDVMGQELVMLLGGNRAFKDYSAQPSEFNGLERVRISDGDLTVRAREILEGYTPEQLDTMPLNEYNGLLRMILNIEGATVGQVSRVLKISRRQLERAAKENR